MIQQSEDTKQLLAALKTVAPTLNDVHKSGRNEAQKYDYAKLEDYVNTVKPALERAGLLVVFSAHEVKTKLKEAYSRQHVGVIEGWNHYVSVSILCRLIHLESGQFIEVKSIGEGVDRGDKATYKAITGGRKYALAMLLNLITTDDPEADEEVDRRAHGTEAAPSKPSSTRRTTSTQSGEPDLSFFNGSGLQVTPVVRGRFTNYEAAPTSGAFRDLYPDSFLSQIARKSTDPQDPNKGMWIPGGRLSFTRAALEAFREKVEQFNNSHFPAGAEIGDPEMPF